MLLSAVYDLVVAQSSSEVPEGLMNNPVYSNPILRLASFWLFPLCVKVKQLAVVTFTL